MEKDPVIVILMASMLEAKPFVMGMSLHPIEKRPFFIFNNDPFRLVISGVGKANAAMAATYCCQKYQPACIINLGAAGSSDYSRQLGEIVQISKVIEPDRIDIITRKTPLYKPHVLKGFKKATLSTADKPVIDPAHRREISKLAHLMDMEGAAVVQACRLFDTRCHLFKFVSDTPEHTGDGDIIENIRKYRTPFYEFFQHTIMPILLKSV